MKKVSLVEIKVSNSQIDTKYRYGIDELSRNEIAEPLSFNVDFSFKCEFFRDNLKIALED